MRRRGDFLFVKKGHRGFGKACVLQGCHRGDGDDTIRYGLTVTKRVGNAVERNRIRRRLRPLADRALMANKAIQALAGFDIAILPKREVLHMASDALARDFARALSDLVAKTGSKRQKRQNSSRPNASGGPSNKSHRKTTA